MSWISKIFRRGRNPEWDELEALPVMQPSTVSGSDRAAKSRPGFFGAASDFGGLAVDARSRKRLAHSRAFTPSQPVASIDGFAGRAELLTRVIRAIEDQQLHVVLYGDRGIGKTSMMRIIAELARSARYVVHYTSSGERAEFSETFRNVASRIRLLYDGQIDPGDEEVERGGTLADRLPPGEFSVSQLTDVLQSIAGTRVLILLDEFDRPVSDRFRASVAELIKNLSDQSIKVQLVIAGVASNLTDLISHLPSIRRNIVGIQVPNMNQDDIRDMVAIAGRKGSLSFSEDAIIKLAHVSAGLPYLAALIGQHALMVADSEGSGQIDEDHIASAATRAADDILGRLSPKVQFALGQAGWFDRAELIGACAIEAVKNSGLIVDPAIIALMTNASPLALSLLEPVTGYPFDAWRFIEDGTSSYVWLSLVNQKGS